MSRDLPVPEALLRSAQALEVLRIWAGPGIRPGCSVRALWKDPTAWGAVFLEAARSVAAAYDAQGRPQGETLSRIRAAFDAGVDRELGESRPPAPSGSPQEAS